MFDIETVATPSAFFGSFGPMTTDEVRAAGNTAGGQGWQLTGTGSVVSPYGGVPQGVSISYADISSAASYSSVSEVLSNAGG